MIWLLLPMTAWVANLFLPKRIHAVILYPCICIVGWLIVTASIMGEFSGYETELMEFDVNHNGEIDDAELTREARELQDLIANDTGRSMGSFFAVPITAIWVGLNFLILYGLELVVKRNS